MTLLQLVTIVEKAAASQPNIGSIVRNDVYRLNAAPSVRYGAFAWLQNEHTTSEDSGLISYSFTLFYVDRLTADKGNEIQIQSTGITTLDNILKALPYFGVFPGPYSFRTFNERFADDCAGAYCTVTLDAQKDSLCPEAQVLIDEGGGVEGWNGCCTERNIQII